MPNPTQDTNVLVTFCSRTGVTEKIALAAAVGAVQARAFIRLRWLREAVEDHAIDRTAGWRENRDRMIKEYVAPREADFLWADALVIASPARPFSPELKSHLDFLSVVQSAGKLHAKVGMAVVDGSAEGGEGEQALVSLHSALAGLDLIAVPCGRADIERARLQGRRVTEVARALVQAERTYAAAVTS